MFGLIMSGAQLLFMSATMVFTITLYPVDDYPLHNNLEDLDTVTMISTHREWWRDDGKGKCVFNGVVVPYVRDWPETVHRGQEDVVLPPELDKIAGQAIIVNKKICKDKPDELLFLVDEYIPRGRITTGRTITAQNLFGLKEEQRPKWLPQVMQRIERVAQHDSDAKVFLADVTAYEAELAAQAKAAALATAASTALTGASNAAIPVAASAPISASTTEAAQPAKTSQAVTPAVQAN